MSLVESWQTVSARRVGNELHIIRPGGSAERYETMRPMEWVNWQVGFGQPVSIKKPVIKFDLACFCRHLSKDTELSASTIITLADAIEKHLKVEME